MHETLLALFRELVASYDPTLDTSDGSEFYRSVISPFFLRLGPSALETDVEELILASLRQEHPDLDISQVSAIYDTLVSTMTTIFAPYRRELVAAKLRQSLDNYESLTTEELNALLANFHTQVQVGSAVETNVRCYYRSPQAVVASPLTEFATTDGRKFYPTTLQSITAAAMSFQVEGGLYYFDVTVAAEDTGTAYDVEAGDISAVRGLTGVLRVANPVAAQASSEKETKAQAVSRSRDALSLRTLATKPGIRFLLREQFPSISSIEIVGAKSPFMLRDFIEGPLTLGGVPEYWSGGSLDVPEEGVHIGGATDVYTYAGAPRTGILVIENIENKGVRLHAGSTAYTDPLVSNDVFVDERGHFVTRGVSASVGFALGADYEDWLLVGEDAYFINDLGETFLSLTDAPGGSPANIPRGQYNLKYEVVRRSAHRVAVPLYDLTAVEDGEPLDSVLPIPGDPSLAPLLDGGNPVAKTSNISDGNLRLPLLRVVSVEEVDPLTRQPTGVTYPAGDVLGARVLSGFANGEDMLTAASGYVRLYFRDKVNVCLPSEEWSAPLLLTSGGNTYRLKALMDLSGVTPAGTEDFPTLTLTTPGDPLDLLAVLPAGHRIGLWDSLSGRADMLMVSSAAVTGLNEVTVSVREGVPYTLSGSESVTVHEGITEAAMEEDAETGLFYLDMLAEVEATAVGAQANLAEGAWFDQVSSALVEGWRVTSAVSSTSFSTRDLVTLDLPAWVNDETDVALTGSSLVLQVSYEYSPNVAAMQAFAEQDDVRPQAEDLLIKHAIPYYLRGTLRVRAADVSRVEQGILSFLATAQPVDPLELSDIVDAAYSAGATKVRLPSPLVVLSLDTHRRWSMSILEDEFVANAVNHVLPDPDHFLVVSGA